MNQFAILLLAPFAAAAITLNSPAFGNAPNPQTDNVRCDSAYSASIDCTSSLAHLRTSTNTPTRATLTELCTPMCIRSLNDWETEVSHQCQDQDLSGDAPEYFEMGQRGWHEVQYNLYWPLCLTDSQTDNFCALDDSLPEWPESDAGLETDAVAEFCRSSCRVQQSFILHRAAAAQGVKVDAFDAGRCGVDASAFEMNAYTFDDFGSASADWPVDGHSRAVESSDHGMLLRGTEVELEELFRTVLGTSKAADEESELR